MVSMKYSFDHIRLVKYPLLPSIVPLHRRTAKVRSVLSMQAQPAFETSSLVFFQALRLT